MRQVIVVGRQDSRGEKSLVAYVVPETGQPVSGSALRRFLQQQLPDYMVPAAFMLLEELPVTPTGKVDRALLPEPDGSRPEVSARYVAPERGSSRRWARFGASC